MSSNIQQQQLPPPPPAHQQQSYYPDQQSQREELYQPRTRTEQPQQQQQQQQQQQRPRATSNFSFHSRKSSGSAGGAKLAPETHEEKEQRRLHTKADPSMALNEAEPSAIAAERSSLASMRGLSFKDSDGNMISEPDRSNPTRSRWERPLDTIRSFEAAIDGNYKRQSYMRSESSEVATNRRSSYYGGTQVSMNERPRQYSNGYYGHGRMSRPESYMDRQNGMGRGDSYYDSTENGPSNGYVPNRARYPRTASEPHFNAGQGVYPAAGAQHSYETVTTASGSGSSAEPNGYSTDPSSENSSVDRITPLREDGNVNNNYGFNGYGNTNSHLNNGYNQYNMTGANGVPRSSNQAPPPPPHVQNSAPPRVPMKLGKTTSNTASIEKPAPAEKRKSWFGKRFSKN